MPRLRRVFSHAFDPAFGSAFHRLWVSTAVSNVGDGVVLAAGPLLLATVTTSPTAVAAATFAQQLPWLLFALVGGALADRLPRRTLVVAGHVVRAGLLGRANARMQLTFTINNLLIGPPVGALLFAVGAALPFGLHAVACGLAAFIVLRVPSSFRRTGPPTTIRADIGDGLRTLWRHRGLRILAVSIFVMNFAGVGAFAIWVLYGKQHLGLTDTQYGMFVATGAVGGMAGAWAYGRLEKRLGQTVLLRGGLIVESLTYLVLALTSNPWVAGATMAVFGVHAIVWGAVASTARQRATPSELLGRVGSVYALASVCGSLLGALLGGVLAARFGLLTPFWLAFGLVAVMVVVAWRRLADVRATQTVQQ